VELSSAFIGVLDPNDTSPVCGYPGEYGTLETVDDVVLYFRRNDVLGGKTQNPRTVFDLKWKGVDYLGNGFRVTAHDLWLRVAQLAVDQIPGQVSEYGAAAAAAVV
jgi:hypothetical protein